MSEDNKKENKPLTVEEKTDVAINSISEKNKSETAEPSLKKLTMQEKLDIVLDSVSTIAGAVNKLVELQTVTPLSERLPDPKAKGAEDTFTPKLDDETYPEEYTPPKFRKLVDEILSKDFGLKIDDFPDRTDMQINIIVPEKYSSLSKEDRDKGAEDIRSRIVPRAMGENGVKEWCQLIRTNLNKFYTKEGVQSPFSNALSISK